MQSSMCQALSLPKGLPTSRYRPRPTVEMPEGLTELPLIDAKTPPDKQVQEHWIAHVQVFNLNDSEQREEYEKIWQMICDGLAVKCEHLTEFKTDTGEFVALLRWAELHYKVPTQ